MTNSYIVKYVVPANEARAAQSGSYRTETLFFTYENIVFNLDEFREDGAVYSIYRASPDGLAKGEPLLILRRNEDGSRVESGPLALPPRGPLRHSCPGCSSETGVCFHRDSAALSYIHLGGRRIGEIATLADAGSPDGSLYSVLILSRPVAQFHVTDPSELLPRVVEQVRANPNFI